MATAAPQRTSVGCTSSAAPRSTRRVDLEEAADPPRQPASWAQTPAARAAQARRLGCRVRPATAAASRGHRGRLPQVSHLLTVSQVRTCMPPQGMVLAPKAKYHTCSPSEAKYGTCSPKQSRAMVLGTCTRKQSMVLGEGWTYLNLLHHARLDSL